LLLVKPFAIVLLVTTSVIYAQDKVQPDASGTVCWPLHFAGVTVGVTDDAQGQRLLGTGVFRADEGHSGGRYYIDPKRTATLHIVEGVDNVVEELTVRSGIDGALKATEYGTAVSRWFDSEEGFGNWHRLRLGSSRDEVVANLGQPRKKEKGDEWVYETICACELPEYLTTGFKQDRIVQLTLYAGE
jgi:hypothetical protein